MAPYSQHAAIAAAVPDAMVGGTVHGPPRMTLTPFWPAAPAVWFRLAEATFHRLNVIDPNLRFDLTLPDRQELIVA